MFEKQSGIKVEADWSSSVDMLARLKGGEIVDVVALSAQAIDALAEAGVIVRGSRLDVASSAVGMAVKQGTPRPDTSSLAKLQAAVLAAPTVAISTGPSGIYLAQLFERLGMMPALKPKLTVVKGKPVGELVAAGEVALGFQQMIELQPVAGVDFWPIPDDAQNVTTFSLGVHAKAPHAEAARQWVAFVGSAAVVPVLKKHGATPLRG
ncbi:MAG: molybdenum transporter substrate-binding protein [Betaproteobacteria bacterium]|nr:molybdenum transporter substrate-binding protein [Betaproteobacteria bacterium]